MKHIKKLFLPLLALFICLVAVAGCGGKMKDDPTPTYSAYHAYLEGRGGKQEFDDLNDSNLGKVDLTISSSSTSISFYFFYSTGGTFTGGTYHSLFIDFYRDQAHPVRINYYETYRTTPELKLNLTGNSTDLKLSSAFSVENVEMKYGDDGEYTDVSPSNDLYSSTRTAALSAVQQSLSWITATLRVALDDDYVTVHDLYAQS